jgi:integrase
MTDEQWAAVFGQLRSNRDRALMALAVSCGARAGELLGVRECDVNWGEQLIMVRRKGSGAEQWLPASSEAFIWLRLYLSECSKPTAAGSIWTARRGEDRYGGQSRELTYDALRAVMRRVNAALGTNWTMHDLRHTCALRMAHDDVLSLRDVQTILGHAQLSTTVGVYLVEDYAAIVRRVARHLAEQASRPPPPPEAPAVGYDAGDLSVLFGRDASS